METVTTRHPGETEFLQAVAEIGRDALTIEKASSAYTQARVLERLCEADRIISFSVVWHDDSGNVQINRGWRVQHSDLLGPYKGGLRWSPDVTPSVLKFLAFEQAFKNALTGLPLGAAKGGADFDPAGRSEGEVNCASPTPSCPRWPRISGRKRMCPPAISAWAMPSLV